MWSDSEVEKIIQLFPEALFSDHIIPRPVENPYTQGHKGKSGRHINTTVPRDDRKMSKTEMSLVDPMWELIDPAPDVRALFLQFNSTFFDGKLSSVEVRWSPRMTLCAGLCCYEGRGGLCSIRLSEPLLKLRPRSDLVETLLHEMIHAFLFVTQNDRDREGHGPNFQFHMRRINAQAGTRITIYHTFHDEVANYQNHWWRCTGPCQQRPPYFGYVKRAMNRAPGPNDTWWSQHQATCSGRFVKIKEPEKSNKSTNRKREIKDQATSLSAPTVVQKSCPSETQIDHIAISYRWRGPITDCRSFWNTFVDSDHVLVRSLFAVRFPGPRKLRTNGMATERLADADVRRTYKNRLLESLLSAPPSDVNSYWDEIATALHGAGNFACGTIHPGALKHWISDRTVALLKSRRNIPAGPEHKLVRRAIKRQVKVRLGSDREVWWKQKAKQMEEAQKAGNTRRLFHLIRATGPRKPPANRWSGRLIDGQVTQA
ncbi:hypothetical protein T265_10775 [Opisthorchis viverrini]|uniref:SprT-like domain-containing protein n=1 Tax=Opisthorchis viverrini TaxID=6198 RepID=A0A074ZC27_OPIVI|nr:hypothetical protein T265_10775 [Opisthorchis viverrini]KER20755.1 hypothetical protein T265_10775 [Opisthorchis viverrini]